MTVHALTLRQYCSGILGSGDLESKLRPPQQSDGRPLDDCKPGPALFIEHPVRNPELAMASGLPNLPRVSALNQPDARIQCLARFAHHELMAVELFAWALLRWPELPSELRREFVLVLADEQRHCRLYIDRLSDLGGSFFSPPHSNYFWKLVPAIAKSAHGPSAFLAAMGLTLEQANLDFTLLYSEAFAVAGDTLSAEIMRQVHEDEIRHVALAAHWLKALGPPGSDLIEAYSEAVPFPFSAARAKARQLDIGSRRRAGLGEPFINFVRAAQSTQNRRKGSTDTKNARLPSQWSPLLYPNVGAEELPGKGGVVITSATLPTLRLWRLLFGNRAHFVPTLTSEKSGDELRTLDASPWPAGLGKAPAAAAFSWLDGSRGIVPWISTARLQLHPSLDRQKISSAPAGAVARVHDKAFAIKLAESENLLPDSLRDLFLVLEPELLLDPDAAIRRMERAVAGWPEHVGRNFTLKPRLGTSGRGRVPGVDGRVDSPAVRGALKRLAKRGGAILEPWFKRKLDLSAQMHVASNGDVTLLGTLEQIAAPSGLYLGHRAEFDSRGRVFSGSAYEEVLRETGAITATHAYAEGFFGPCGIDAFTIDTSSDSSANTSAEQLDEGETPKEILRPLVEFNARFTMGTISIGIVRRALEQIREPLALTPGMRCAFYFGLDAPHTGWDQVFDTVPGKKWLIPLWHPADDMKPAILFAESCAALDDVIAAARRPKPRRKGPRKVAAP